MNDDPYLTEVLYAKIIDQDEILQRKCEKTALTGGVQKNFTISSVFCT